MDPVVVSIVVASTLAAIALVILILREAKRLKGLRQISPLIDESFDFAPGRLSEHNWADFEGALPDLEQVICVADIVQRPENGLERAVKANFARGVKYSFLVSKSKATDELHGFVEMFELLAMLVSKTVGGTVKPAELVSIKCLPVDWDNVPFVFYRLKAREGEAKARTIAFYGNKKNAGIGDSYRLLPPYVADALATALVSEAPSDILDILAGMNEDIYLNPSAIPEIWRAKFQAPLLSAAKPQRLN